MYTRYAEQRGWKIEIISATEGELGGYKDIQLAVKSRDPANPVFGRLKYEGGVHRVQRVPGDRVAGPHPHLRRGRARAARGEEVDVTIDQNDLRIDVYRSSGPAGRASTRPTRRAHHAPPDRRHRRDAEREEPAAEPEAGMRVLRARCWRCARGAGRQGQRGRGAQIRTVDRSEKVRTYNFPDNRVADHRSGYKANNLMQVLDGDLDAVIQSLVDGRHRRQARRRGLRMTPLRSAISNATERLAAAGVDSPEHDARALAVHVLGLARPSDLLMVDALDEHQASAYDELVGRRADRVPLQHLTGSVGFRYLSLEVGPGVFVPRPETESVVQCAVDALQGVPARCASTCAPAAARSPSRWPTSCPGRWCTRRARPGRPGVDPPQRRHRVEAGDPEVQLHLGSAEDALPGFDGTLDLVISNPPYVATTEAHIPDPEVVDHDPGIALWAGRGRAGRHPLVEQAARRLLKPGGLVVVEHSDRQGRSAPRCSSGRRLERGRRPPRLRRPRPLRHRARGLHDP
jgi:methylase of polypeptide subunit release factors/protein subunit release factor B